MDDVKDILEEVYDDGDDIYDKLSDDAKDILEKVYDDGDDIFEEDSDENKDILEEVFDDGDDIFESILMMLKTYLRKILRMKGVSSVFQGCLMLVSRFKLSFEGV